MGAEGISLAKGAEGRSKVGEGAGCEAYVPILRLVGGPLSGCIVLFHWKEQETASKGRKSLVAVASCPLDRGRRGILAGSYKAVGRGEGGGEKSWAHVPTGQGSALALHTRERKRIHEGPSKQEEPS